MFKWSKDIREMGPSEIRGRNQLGKYIVIGATINDDRIQGMDSLTGF